MENMAQYAVNSQYFTIYQGCDGVVAVFKSVKTGIVTQKCEYSGEGSLWWPGEGFIDVTPKTTYTYNPI